jgi:hypothetical protein
MSVEIRVTIVNTITAWIIRYSRGKYYWARYRYEIWTRGKIANPCMKPETAAMTIIGF